jgi:modulator of drug activity B
MANVLILNAHHTYPFSEGLLNKTLVDHASLQLQSKGYAICVVNVDDGWSVDEQLVHHIWADFIILQSPTNWMGVPWTFKKYMDEVYTAGMGGELCRGDGRDPNNPKSNYGGGGSLSAKHYMLSLTFNAPKEAFGCKEEYLFGGKSVDDLWFPMHMNFRFFGMDALETFACFDVVKDATVNQDLDRYTQHLERNFATLK